MHAQAYDFVKKVVTSMGVLSPVYEIGSRNINGSVRPLFGDATYWGVDLVQGPDVDIVADAAIYCPPIVPKTVVCCEVLEHASNAQGIVTQAALLLEKDGLLIITCAGPGRAPHSAVDGGALRDGEFYRNIPLDELESWLGEMTPLLAISNGINHDVYYAGRKA